jgi:hypothetical protein
LGMARVREVGVGLRVRARARVRVREGLRVTARGGGGGGSLGVTGGAALGFETRPKAEKNVAFHWLKRSRADLGLE